MAPIPMRFGDDTRTVPYCVESQVEHPPGIAKLAAGRFHVWRSGDLTSVLSTASAILVSRALADVLASHAEVGWQRREITIVDPPDGEVSGYVELIVDQEIAPDALPSDVSGKRVWRYGADNLFVSPELAGILAARFPDLTFSAGISVFAAMKAH
jgi:hypothetical protein